MTANDSEIHVDETFDFRALLGDSIEATVETLTVTSQTEVTATFTLPWEHWRRTIDEGLFHLDETTQPPTFEDGQPVELTGRLRSAVARGLSDDTEAIRERFTDSSDPLRSTEAWFATEVAQSIDLPDDPDLEGAYASLGSETQWAEYDPASTAQSVLETVTDELDAQNWHYDVVDDESQFVQFDVALDEIRSWSMVVHIDELERRCTLYSLFPAPIPYHDRPEAALALMAANYDLTHGSFEFDVTDGVVSFRTRVLVDAESLAVALGGHIGIVAEQYDTIDRWTENGTVSDSSSDLSSPTAPGMSEADQREAHLPTDLLESLEHDATSDRHDADDHSTDYHGEADKSRDYHDTDEKASSHYDAGTDASDHESESETVDSEE